MTRQDESGAALSGLVSPEAVGKISLYLELLKRWQEVTNLVSSRAFDSMWGRHVVDSIHLQRQFPDKTTWIDFGSGSGFPAIILGILLADAKGAQIHCVESDGRKCSFLRIVAQKLRVPVKVHNRRAEYISPEVTGMVDAVTARAFSSIEYIMRLSEAYLRGGAVLILPRGESSKREVEAIDPNRYTLIAHANPQAGGGIFLQIQLRTGRLS